MNPTLLTPKDAGKFHCLAGGCQDNCCRRSVRAMNIDRAYYEKYKTISGDFGRHVMDSIEERDGIFYFKTTSDGQCTLLDEFGFCSLQFELGEEYLCDSCRLYPRTADYFCGSLEFSLRMSCPEVVKILLFQGPAAEFESLPMAQASANVPATATFENEEYLIRDALFDILRQDSITLMDKLAFIGVLIHSVTKLDASFTQQLTATISAYKGYLTTPDMLDSLRAKFTSMEESIRKNVLGQIAQVAIQMATGTNTIPEGLENAHYYGLIERLGAAGPDSLTDAYDRLVIPYINENPQVFVNYLLHIILETKLPKGTADYNEAYVALVGEFLVLLLFAAGMFNKSEAITHEEMAAAIYLFHRKAGTIPGFSKQMAQIFQGNDIALLLGMLGDIK